MASPLTWNLAAPANGDQISVFPALHRGDKTTLSVVLGTLAPFGTTTTAWRQTQINNDEWLTSNATYTGTVWNRDDVTLPSYAIVLNYTNARVEVQYAAAAANPITWTVLSIFPSVAAAVNFVYLQASATGSPTQILAFGSDANVDIQGIPRGTGAFKPFNLQPIGGLKSIALAVPAAPTVVVNGATGVVTWSYAVTAVGAGGETLASVNGTVTNGNATLTGANFNAISWVAVTGAAQYKVYRTAAGGTPATTGLIGTINNGATLSLNDTGLAAGAAVPAIDTSAYVGASNIPPTSNLTVDSVRQAALAWAAGTPGLVTVKSLAGYTKALAATRLIVRGVVSLVVIAAQAVPTLMRVAVGASIVDFPIGLGPFTAGGGLSFPFEAVFTGVAAGAVTVTVSVGRNDSTAGQVTNNPNSTDLAGYTQTSSVYDISEN